MDLINYLNKLILYPIFSIPFAVLFVSLAAVWLMINLRFINLRPKITVRDDLTSNKDKGISKLSAFMSSAGGTLGIGNIFGGAMAVTIAGPGALFWIIIFGFLASIVKFCEVYLGHKFRLISPDGKITGGAFYYIEKVFTKGIFSYIPLTYAVSLFVAYIFAGTFQVQQISELVSLNIFGKPIANSTEKIIFAIPIAILVGLSIFSGITGIAKNLSKLVPVMMVVYVALSLQIVFANLANLPSVLSSIMSCATDISGFGMVMGYSLHRLLFASDSGTGVSSIANSQSSASSLQQARIVTLEPILVSITMALTGLCVMLSGADILAREGGYLGIKIASIAFNHNALSSYMFLFTILLFGLTTAMSHGYNIEQAWNYIGKNRKTNMCRILYLAMIFIVSVQDMSVLMPIIDLAFFICIFINVIAMIILCPVIKKELCK